MDFIIRYVHDPSQQEGSPSCDEHCGDQLGSQLVRVPINIYQLGLGLINVIDNVSLKYN